MLFCPVVYWGGKNKNEGPHRRTVQVFLTWRESMPLVGVKTGKLPDTALPKLTPATLRKLPTACRLHSKEVTRKYQLGCHSVKSASSVTPSFLLKNWAVVPVSVEALSCVVYGMCRLLLQALPPLWWLCFFAYLQTVALATAMSSPCGVLPWML